MRKRGFFAALFLAALAWASPAMAAENWAMGFDHHSVCGLLGGKPVYETAYFTNYVFWMQDTISPDALPSADVTSADRLTIKGGNYTARTWTLPPEDEKVQNVEKTFQLSSFDHDGTNLKGNYYPSKDGVKVTFLPPADGGLQNVPVEWTLFGVHRTTRVPKFLTTPKQEETAVPYIELTLSGDNVTGFKWRFIDPRDPSKAISLSCGADVVFWRFNKDIGIPPNEYKRVSKNFPTGTPLEGTEDLGGNNIPLDKFSTRFRLVRDDMKETDAQGLVSRGTYAWDFEQIKESDEGFQSKGTLAAPIALKVGEEKTITFTLKAGMDITLKTLISDPTVADRSGSWTRDSNGVCTFPLKGLKAGKTNLCIPYYGSNDIYLSQPVEVTVTGGNTSQDIKPDPDEPKPGSDGYTSGDVVVPLDPALWTSVRGTPDAQGNTPMTIRVSIRTKKELLSASVEAKGLDFSKVKFFRNRTDSAASVSATSFNYIVEITGTVARENLNAAVIEALNYRLVGDTKDTRLALGTGIRLSKMKDRTPPLLDPNPGQKSKSSGGGCNAGFAALALLGAASLFLRRR